MRNLVFWALAAMLPLAALPSHAQEPAEGNRGSVFTTPPAEEAAVEEVEEVDVEEVETEEAEEAEAAVTITPVDVWWGNRSISYGNYIKFDWTLPAADNRTDCEKYGTNCPEGPWDKIFFDMNKAFLRADAIQECHKVLQYLQMNTGKGVVIEGHCDSGPEKSSASLTANRAEAVKRWLVENGIDASRIRTMGSTSPVPGVGADQHQLQRRAIVNSTP